MKISPFMSDGSALPATLSEDATVLGLGTYRIESCHQSARWQSSFAATVIFPGSGIVWWLRQLQFLVPTAYHRARPI